MEAQITNSTLLTVFFEDSIGYYRFFWKVTPDNDEAFKALQDAVLLVLVDGTHPNVSMIKMSAKFLDKFAKIYVPHNNYVIVQLIKFEKTLSMQVFVEKMYQRKVEFFYRKDEAVFFLKKQRELFWERMPEIQKKGIEQQIEEFDISVLDTEKQLEVLAQKSRLNSLMNMRETNLIDAETFLRHHSQIIFYFSKLINRKHE